MQVKRWSKWTRKKNSSENQRYKAIKEKPNWWWFHISNQFNKLSNNFRIESFRSVRRDIVFHLFFLFIRSPRNKLKSHCHTAIWPPHMWVVFDFKHAIKKRQQIDSTVSVSNSNDFFIFVFCCFRVPLSKLFFHLFLNH